MSAVAKVLVVGGGIGGLTASVALRQQGIDVDLIEINPVFRVYGVGIIQPNNTLRALDRIGLARRCVELGVPFAGWRVFDAHGQHVMDAPNESRAAPEMPPNNGITRPTFHVVLSEAARDHGVSIRLGTTVSNLEETEDRVRVTFSDGGAADYDVVIGCDGIYSDMRSRVFGDEPSPQFTGQSVWRYNLPRPEGMEWGEIHSGPTSKAGLVPMRADLMYIFLVSAEPDNPRFEPALLPELMRARMVGFTGKIDEMRALITDPAEVVYKPMETFLLPNPWHTGRTVIIGDAAHSSTPHLGQGAALAIEDAVLLAELLGQDRELSSIFPEFMARRYDRAKLVVQSSNQIAAWEMEGWRGIENPDARPGELLHSATLAMQEDY